MNRVVQADAFTEGLRGFACPREAMDYPLRQEIVGEYARGYLSLFIERYEATLDSLVPELRRLVQSAIPFGAAWDITFGHVRRAVHMNSDRPRAIGAALVDPTRKGHLGHAIPIGTHSLRILDNDGLDNDGSIVAALFGDGLAPATLAVSQIQASCQRATEILKNHSPRYLAWLDGVIRCVLPRDGSDGFLHSASSMDWPGVVSISFPCGAAALAETLVHEVSHQYLNIVQRLGPIVNGRDDTLYYSPIKGTQRPIQAILVAYHAVGNMLLFYRDCIDTGISDNGYCQNNLNRHREDAIMLMKYLEGSDGLTTTGSLIVETLGHHLRGRVL